MTSRLFSPLFSLILSYSLLAEANSVDRDAKIWTAEQAIEYERFVNEQNRLQPTVKPFIINWISGGESTTPSVRSNEILPYSNEEMAQILSFETPQTCGEGRNYLNAQLAKVDRVFRLTRAYPQNQNSVPMACVTFIMKKFFEPALSAPKRMFAYCASDEGRPEPDPNDPTKHKYYMQPCVTESYVNTVYNSFRDVAECLNLPQKEFLPKYFNESGFHINAYGAGKDAGVGQLTASAIEIGVNRLKSYANEMKLSGKASCQRILAQQEILEPLDISFRNRCNLMASPQNPLRNFLYSAIFYRENLRYVAGIHYRQGEDVLIYADGNQRPLKNQAQEELGGAFERMQVREKLDRLGLREANLHRLKNMVVTLGYNSGVQTAMNRLNDYLNLRLEHTQKESQLQLTAKDFDFDQVDVAPLRKLALPKNPKKDSTPEEIEEIKKSEILRMAQFKKAYEKAYQLSFPEFLVLRTNAGPKPPEGVNPYELYGFPGYLSALAQKNKILKVNFPGGECTEDEYLKLRN